MSEIIRNDAGGLLVDDSPDKFVVSPVPGLPGTELQDVLNSAGAVAVEFNRKKLLTSATAGDLTFDVDDTGFAIGALASFNDVLGVFVCVSPSQYSSPPLASVPMEVVGESGNVWVRIDKLSRPLKTHDTLYVGCIGTPVSNSGLTSGDGFMSGFYMGDMFGNSMEDVNQAMTVILTSNAPSPFAPQGDFGGGFLAETLVTINSGDVCAIQTDGTIAPAIADSDAHAALALGLAINTATFPSADRLAIIVAFGLGIRKFNAETGITFVAGNSIYLSGTEPGHVTNVAPAHARQMGICIANDESGLSGLLRI